MKLSDGEKLILVMLADISKRLKGEPEIDPEFVSKTIYYDHLWGFDWHLNGFPFEDRDTPPNVSEVADIFDMYRMVMSSFVRLDKPEQERVRKALGYRAGDLDEFPGFDANHDPHFGIARYMVETLERFTNLKGATNNSHNQASLPRYRAMLQKFKPLTSKLTLEDFTSDEILTIFGAD